MSGNYRVLYVEDEPGAAEILKLYLVREGYSVSHFDNAEDAARALQNLVFDMALLDVMLPGGDGRSLLKTAVEKHIPAIMVTARVDEEARLEGFELGADDYICKPYSPREVVSRVNALLKRSYRGHQQRRLVFEDLSIDLDSAAVSLSGVPVALTASEYSLLVWLASRPGQVFSRASLLDALWRENPDVTERTVDTHLANLRKKLADSRQAPRFIATRHGLGYCFIAKECQP